MAITKIDDADDSNYDPYSLTLDTLPPAWMTRKLNDAFEKEKTEEWYRLKAKEIDERLNLNRTKRG